MHTCLKISTILIHAHTCIYTYIKMLYKTHTLANSDMLQFILLFCIMPVVLQLQLQLQTITTTTALPLKKNRIYPVLVHVNVLVSLTNSYPYKSKCEIISSMLHYRYRQMNSRVNKIQSDINVIFIRQRKWNRYTICRSIYNIKN